MDENQTNLSRPKFNAKALAAYGLFIAVTMLVGGAIGVSTAPADWYAGLAKPPFNPPNWIFAPVWSVLYVFIGIAGARIWLKAPKSAAMALWGAQMLANWLWSPVFFTLNLLWPALAIITAILVMILLFIRAAAPIDRVAAWLFAPYAVWVSFATLLNAAIAFLN